MDRGRSPVGPCTLEKYRNNIIFPVLGSCNLVSRVILRSYPRFLVVVDSFDGRVSRIIRSLRPYMPNGSILFLLLLPPISGGIDKGDNEGKQNIL